MSLNAWASKTGSAADLRGATACAVAGKVYVTGPDAALRRYDPATDTWATLAAPPTTQNGSVSAAVGSKIYVLTATNTGSAGTSTQPFYMYDTAANTWSALASLSTYGDTGAAMCAGSDSKLYVFGGQNNGTGTNAQTQRYDPTTDTWTTRQDMPKSLMSHAAALGRDGKLYIFGGSNSQNVSDNTTTYVYDPVTNAWASKAAALPRQRARFAAVTGADGLIYLLGGFTYGPPTSTPTAVDVYTPASDIYTTGPSLPAARNFATAALAGQLIVVPGGTVSGSTDPTLVGATETAPNAPTLNAPANNATLDRTVTQRFTWTFSDPDAGDSQSAFDLRWRTISSGGAVGVWNIISGTTPNQYVDIASGTFPASQIEWQVDTYDSLNSLGPWSGSGFFTSATPPAGPTITSPTNNASIGASSQVVTFSYPSLTAYRYKVVDSTGATVVPLTTVTDVNSRSFTISPLANGSTVTTTLAVLANGLWSSDVSITNTVSYLPPPNPTGSVSLIDPVRMWTQVVITNPAPQSGVTLPTAYNNVDRSENGGPAVTIARMVAPNGTVIDKNPVYNNSVGVTVTYTVRAVAANGVTAVSVDPPQYATGSFGTAAFGAGAFGTGG